MSTRGSIESYKSRVPAKPATDPVKAIKSILKQALKPHSVPEDIQLSVYYIAGVSKDLDTQIESVIFTPEFLYVAEVGTGRLAGVSISFEESGWGDPTFPDFSEHALRSIKDRSNKELIFPAAAGELLVGVVAGTPEDKVIKAVSKFASKVTKISTDLYEAKVKPFDEEAIAREIEKIEFVRYAELNHILRVIDFEPGWRVTRVL
ncbi:hypothetical protein DES53_107321 [Roseimicrobium gellanilyticum]|uniref:Uncharacterized protein n=1 Tax=Roseimicrobium gellanilyticum TaxID=748857 RepID=A0A366HG46_9BACT|nr:hypothetical protein [Roseimicrobium gellanilyticum]RBP41488.1 hypothetical protein DES53_107321 [Roseimicrobium gellanilyticum]